VIYLEGLHEAKGAENKLEVNHFECFECFEEFRWVVLLCLVFESY